MGEIIITGSFVWQIGIVVHKYYEMKLKNSKLLAMAAIAFTSQLIFYWVFNKSTNILLFPAGYALAAFIYLILVSSGVVKSFLSFNKNEH